METWALLGAYVLGFALLQVYLYRYFTNRGSSESNGPATGVSNAGSPLDGTPESDHAGPSPPDVPGDHTGSTDGRSPEAVVRCGECGAYNRQEQMFVYCRECGNRL